MKADMTLKRWTKGLDYGLFMICVPTNFQTDLRLTIKNRGPRAVRLKMKYPKSYG